MTAPIEVHTELLGVTALVGSLWTHQRRRVESATFEYAASYIAHPHAYEIDPSLPLTSGSHQTPGQKAIFAAFSDAAPDRWGRGLMKRAEKARTLAAAETPRTLTEIDFVLGVIDELRQGALRFRLEGTTTFLAPESEGVPHLVSLPRLLTAADHVDQDAVSDVEIRLLLRAGGSLGGARPKAGVRLPSGRLAIAKFPKSKDDEWDVMAWEKLTLDLAHDVGIEVPVSTLVRVSNRNVLVLERFDRTASGRLAYASAMTLLEATEGDKRSYLEIAEVVERNSPNATADLQQLWLRILFFVLVSNTDDHLRNHGFLRRSTGGWSLAPAFDMNPEPTAGEKSLNTYIDDSDDSASIPLVLGVAEQFRVSKSHAERSLSSVIETVRTWRKRARALGIGEDEIQRMSDAFTQL